MLQVRSFTINPLVSFKNWIYVLFLFFNVNKLFVMIDVRAKTDSYLIDWQLRLQCWVVTCWPCWFSLGSPVSSHCPKTPSEWTVMIEIVTRSDCMCRVPCDGLALHLRQIPTLCYRWTYKWFILFIFCHSQASRQATHREQGKRLEQRNKWVAITV